MRPSPTLAHNLRRQFRIPDDRHDDDHDGTLINHGTIDSTGSSFITDVSINNTGTMRPPAAS